MINICLIYSKQNIGIYSNMKLVLTTVAAMVMATSSFAADLGASIDVEVAENQTTEKFEAKTTVNLDVAAGDGLAFGAISLQSIDNASVGIDEWHIGTQVAGTTVSFGDQGGIMPEAIAATGFDTLADTNAAMTESLQVNALGFGVALGFTDIRTDASEITNIQGSYTLGLPVAEVTGAIDYNRTTEEYTYAVQADADVLGLAVGTTATYALSTWAYEADTTVSGITAYLNGDENDALQHIGVAHTRDLNGLQLTGKVDYDTDNAQVSPSIKLSFNF